MVQMETLQCQGLGTKVSKSRKFTIKEIILFFLDARLNVGDNEISSHHFEDILPRYGDSNWRLKHNPSSYSRAWRAMKSNGSSDLEKIGVYSVTRKPTKSKEATWILNTLKLQSEQLTIEEM
jgi:hypothetical protein